MYYWTPFQEAHLKKNYHLVPTELLVEYYKKTPQAIHCKARKLGCARRNRRWTQAERDFLLEWKRRSIYALAEILRIPHSKVYGRLNRLRYLEKRNASQRSVAKGDYENRNAQVQSRAAP